MNVKQLKEKLNEFPDDMEVLVDEETQFSQLQNELISSQDLWYVTSIPNSRGETYNYWEYPTLHSRNVIKKERVLILNW